MGITVWSKEQASPERPPKDTDMRRAQTIIRGAWIPVIAGAILALYADDRVLLLAGVLLWFIAFSTQVAVSAVVLRNGKTPAR